MAVSETPKTPINRHALRTLGTRRRQAILQILRSSLAPAKKLASCLVFLLVGSLQLLCSAQSRTDIDWISLLDQQPYTAASADALSKSQHDTALAIVGVEKRMAREAHGESWRTHLQLDALSKSLLGAREQGQLDLADSEVIEQTWRRMVGIAAGLEMPELMELRRCLSRTIFLRRRFAADGRLRDEWGQRRQEISQALAGAGTNLSLDHHRLLSPNLRWLVVHEQLQPLVSAIRSTCYPNLAVDLGTDAILQLSTRNVSQSRPVNKHLHGIQIVGLAQFAGSARLLPINSDRCFQGKIQLDGQVATQLHGIRGRLELALSSSTSVTSHANLVNRETIISAFPSHSSAHSTLCNPRVAARRDGPIARLVERIGLARIMEQSAEIRESISDEVARLVSEEFDRQVTEEVADLQSTINRSWLVSADRLDIRPALIASSSTESGARWSMSIHGQSGLTASTPISQRDDANYVAVHLHESLLNRICERVFAGVRINSIAAALDSVGLKKISALPAKDLHVRFSEDAPISFQFDVDPSGGNCVLMRVSGAGYEFDGLKLVAMDFLVRYGIGSSGEKLRLSRLGAIEIYPPKKGRSLRFIQQRNILAKRLDRDFPDEWSISIEEILSRASSSTNWPELWIGRIQIDNGWLSVGVRK